jgi:hypothetical protein
MTPIPIEGFLAIRVPIRMNGRASLITGSTSRHWWNPPVSRIQVGSEGSREGVKAYFEGQACSRAKAMA